MGEPAFKVIDHNNREQLNMLENLPMQLQSGGLSIFMVAITGGKEPTIVKL
jgi:hypothetical protein